LSAPAAVATKVRPPPMPRSTGPVLSQARSVLSVTRSVSVIARSPQRFTRNLWGKNSGAVPKSWGQCIYPTIYPTGIVRYAEIACYLMTTDATLTN